VSPPRDEKPKSTSLSRPAAPYWAAAAAGLRRAPTAMVRLLAAGVQMLESPGPSLPAEVTTTTPGFFQRKPSRKRSMALRPSISDPTP